MRRIIAGFARNQVFANLIAIIIIFAGVTSTTLMIREVLPSFAVESIIVRVPFPGAGPEEVEEGISLRIEEAIESVQGIKRYTTTSSEGMAVAFIDVRTGEDVQIVKDRITDRINAIQTFPDDAENPSISEFIIRRLTMVVTVSGDLPEEQLKILADSMRDDLMQLPAVSDVEVQGTRDYEISIEIDEETLRKYGLTLEEVARIVRNSSLNLPGGTVRTDREEITIRTMGRGYVGTDYARIPIITTPDGTHLTLSQIATIHDGFVEDRFINRFNGKPAVSLFIYNGEDEDALVIASAVQDFVDDKRAEFERLGLSEHVGVDIWLNQSGFITERIELLRNNGLLGLALVFLMLWLFLDLRLAFWVSLGIPISLAGGMFLMLVLGETINMISLFAMIMVLGIVVDDAIVVGESIYVHRKMGKGPTRAAVDGVAEVAMPVFCAVSTTIVAFMPLIFIEGVFGKFIKVIPIVIICALLVSLVESLVILPAHLGDLPDLNKRVPTHNRFTRGFQQWRLWFAHLMEDFINVKYHDILRFVLGWRYVTFAVVVLMMLVTVGMIRGGMVKYIMFPEIDTYYLTAKVEFPEGTPLEVTQEAIMQLERAMLEVADEVPTKSGNSMIIGMMSSVGMVNEFDGTVGRLRPHAGQIMVELADSDERGVHYRDIVRAWQDKTGRIPGAITVSIQGDAGGPPGKPVEVWLLGQDLEQLKLAAADVKNRLEQFTGVFDIEDDFRAGKRELRATLLPEARNLGLTTSDLGRQLRAAYYGDEVLRVQRGRDEVKVWVRYPEEQRRQTASLDDLRVRTPEGNEIPLASVAHVTLEDGYTAITRKDGLRRIAVTADVFSEVANAGEIREALEQDTLVHFHNKYPGVTYALEGQSADDREALSSLTLGFPLAVLGIYLIIATLFRSYVQPIVILVTVPFGMIGAVWAHLVMGYAISMMSMFGLVALTGIVVNGAIVLIESINHRLADGMPFVDAVVGGTCRRFRPILLTTVTTMGGLAPLILGRSLQAQFLIPMALTIAAGVGFATVLTLVVIPCLMYILNDIRLGGTWFLTGRFPTREAVEPASHRPMENTGMESPVSLTRRPPQPDPAG